MDTHKEHAQSLLLMLGLLFTPAPAEQGAGAKLQVLRDAGRGSQAVHAGGLLKSPNPVLPSYGWETWAQGCSLAFSPQTHLAQS